MPRPFALLVLFVALSAFGAEACQDGPPVGGGSAGGGQGGAGGCPSGPHASFRLTITAVDGAVPPDTALDVAWSVGKQTFELDEQATWKSLVDGNVVCDVDPNAPPPTGLKQLVCELWTTGPTDVTVRAKGYSDRQQTLAPKLSERCGGALTSDAALVLARPVPDAGP